MKKLTIQINQFEIWIANLNPQIRAETGKFSPVIIVQTNLLNKISHPCTIVCAITTNVHNDSDILRVYLKKGMVNLHENCDVMLDQIRAIDNKRLIKKVEKLPTNLIEKIQENISIIIARE